MAYFCKVMPKNLLSVLNTTPYRVGNIIVRYKTARARTTPDRPGAKGNDPQTQNMTTALDNNQGRNSREASGITTSVRSIGEGSRAPEAISDATRDGTN